MENSREIRLGEICTFNASSYTPNMNWKYVNYLDTGNITEGQIETIQKIDLIKNKLPSRAKRRVKYNSIVYSTVRPNQKHFGIVKDLPENFLVSTGFAVLDVDENQADADFIYYYLMQQEVIDELEALAEQNVSTYPSIKPSDIANLKIKLPSLEVQRKIAAILNGLEAKQSINRKINDNLEQQVMATFRQLFNQDTRSQKIVRAEEYFDISIGKTPPRKESQWFSENSSDYVWISISDMNKCGLYIQNSAEYLTHDAVKKFNIKIVPDNTVILSFKLTVGRVAITDGNITTNEAIAHFKTGNPQITEYLYCYLKNFNFQTLGSTSSIATAINSRIVKQLPFIVPNDDTLKKFHNIAAPIFMVIKTNQHENGYLLKLRNELLPKLISGNCEFFDSLY